MTCPAIEQWSQETQKGRLVANARKNLQLEEGGRENVDA